MFELLKSLLKPKPPVTVVVTGPVEIFDFHQQDLVTEPHRKRWWGGRRVRGLELWHYLDEELRQLGIRGGDLQLAYDAGRNELLAVTTWDLQSPLSERHLKALTDFTVAQWNDGIGEGAFGGLQERYSQSLDYVPVGKEQQLRVEQIVR